MCRNAVFLGTGTHVRVLGEGRKRPATPLTRETAAVLKAWLCEVPDSADSIVFPSARGTRLSSDGIECLLARYVLTAAKACPPLAHKLVTPAVLLHTAAMKLLQARVDRSLIALLLGHESVETTQMYLDANLVMNEQAFAKAAPPGSKTGRHHPDDQLLAFLKGL